MNKKGFTLVELILVIVIIGIITLIASTGILDALEKNRVKSAEAVEEMIIDNLKMYNTDTEEDYWCVENSEVGFVEGCKSVRDIRPVTLEELLNTNRDVSLGECLLENVSSSNLMEVYKNPGNFYEYRVKIVCSKQISKAKKENSTKYSTDGYTLNTGVRPDNIYYETDVKDIPISDVASANTVPDTVNVTFSDNDNSGLLGVICGLTIRDPDDNIVHNIGSSGESTAVLKPGVTYSVMMRGCDGDDIGIISGASVDADGYSISDFRDEKGESFFLLTVGNVDATVHVTGTNGTCITADTLITLANGEKKRVDKLTGKENLLVWDFDKGEISSAPIVFIEPEKDKVYNIIHLFFENNKDIEISYEHGFFDYTLGKYIYINENNPEQYIGHKFVMNDVDGYKLVALTNIKRETKRTAVYGLTTFKYFNFFNNDMLSIEGNITGMFNYFDVDKKTMQYDPQKKRADIEKYGLLTYDDLKKHTGNLISELGFEAYDGKYLNVSIGKGLIDWNGIKALAERYGEFTDK